jgi:hypothetical protein
MNEAAEIARAVAPGIHTLPVEGNTCELHAYHAPMPTYFEVHHICPRSWWPYLLFSDEVRNLTAVLCRTGHGNVHFHLVGLMRAYEHIDPGIEGQTAKIAAAWSDYDAPFDRSVSMARRAMARAVQSGGGKLEDLIADGKYGQI